MNGLFGQPVFSVEDREYVWADVLLAAGLRGDWTELEESSRQAAACLSRARETGDLPPTDEVESAATEFRYENDLLTAEETEAWLEKWELTAEDWMAYLRGSLLRERWADELKDIVESHPVAAEEVARFVKAEGACSGRFLELAERLAERAAVGARLEASATGTDGEPTGDTGDAGEPDDAALSSPVFAVFPDLESEEVRERLARLAQLERAFERFRDEIVTERAVQDQIRAHHLEWIRFSCRYVRLEDEEAAREGALCVREDHCDLNDVAADAKTEVREETFYLDDVEGVLKDQLLGARPGELIGPVAINGGFGLFEIREKVIPREDDPELRQRAEAAVLERVVRREVENRVEWLLPASGASAQ